ncbi:hypothetical protein P5673_032461 [Acropora cervicornis]|uniref:Uncharacterized protein n=1 Tax=Acropora cervicornis TaxID=6130 RepID=A0AAD9PR67_ACRCE|nr:hypothetical protein P5673_032461 [Acropora cervicornis]
MPLVGLRPGFGVFESVVRVSNKNKFGESAAVSCGFLSTFSLKMSSFEELVLSCVDKGIPGAATKTSSVSKIYTNCTSQVEDRKRKNDQSMCQRAHPSSSFLYNTKEDLESHNCCTK